jgi:hypothetical protein
MIEMNELLVKISRRFCHVSIEDMTNLEKKVARDLKDAGYLVQYISEDGPAYKVNEKAKSK